jgi:hypothetical protein
MSKANIKSLYAKFQTDQQKEVSGADLDLGVCVITCARSGGMNLEFEKAYTEAFAPYNQVMDLGEMPEGKARELTYDVYARTIIKRWRFRDPETLELRDGLGLDDEGNVVPATVQNICELFASAHDMYIKIRNFAQSMESFLVSGRGVAAKN